jgi:hypothetical protein
MGAGIGYSADNGFSKEMRGTKSGKSRALALHGLLK